MADCLRDWLDGLGASTAPVAVPGLITPEVWLDHGDGRPEWMLWGKAQPKESCPAHPLLCHMLDVAAVAGRLLTNTLPAGLRNRLLSLSDDPVEALKKLLFIIALHDIGKATPAFQAKVEWTRRLLPPRGFDLKADEGARFHGDIGLFLLKRILEEKGAESALALRLARAVAAHHGQFPTNVAGLKPPGSRERGEGPQWDLARASIGRCVGDFFGVSSVSTIGELDHAYVVLLAGLTSVADWIGSMEGFFRYELPQADLTSYWTLALARADDALQGAGFRPAPTTQVKAFRGLFPQLEPWPLHEAADAVAQMLDGASLVIVEAPMGEGKTEAALVLANAAAAHTGESGFYIGLPTQATANQMFGRIERFLERTREGQPSTLLLAHGEAALVDRFRRLKVRSVSDGDRDGDRLGSVRAEEWFLSKKRALLGEFAVGTIDQALLGVMRVPHAFVRLYGLAGKIVVFDEVHAYDTYTSNLLDRLVEWLAAVGTSVILVSATLPAARRRDLIGAYQRGARLSETEMPEVLYPRIALVSRKGNTVRSFAPRRAARSIRIERAQDDLDALADYAIREAGHSRCVGWICNTVARAQAATKRVRELAPELARLLLHSRLFPKDREEREKRLEGWLGPQRNGNQRPDGCVVIGTQVLEQSLDIDFDVLLTDVAPMDLVLQRAGRLWRHERSNRVDGQDGPRVVVVCPDGSWKDASLDRVARVYAEVAELLVRRTLRKLEETDRITLPDDIELLVQEVYADNGVPAEEELLDAFMDRHGRQAVQRNLADQKLMPHPYVVDDPFGNFRVFLEEDDDPVLHQQLRADTRLGPPTVELVCLEQRGNQVLVGDGDDTPLDLSREPDRVLVERLVHRSIGLSSKPVFGAIMADPATAPEGWKRSPLLRYRRRLAFADGRAHVGGTTLTLDPELGLCIHRAGDAQ